jgi:hypothetical protein
MLTNDDVRSHYNEIINKYTSDYVDTCTSRLSATGVRIN